MREIIAILFVVLPAVLFAQIPANLDTPENVEFVKRVEKYINSMTQVEGSFKQTSSNGAIDGGKFYIKRPGRMRLEYNSPMLLVADGESLVYYDKKLDQISYLSLNSQPAAVVLKDNVRLADGASGINIKDIQMEEGRTYLTLSHAYEKQSGLMALAFVENPFRLYGWRVKDAQGITTDVVLTSIEPVEGLADSLFKITRKGAFGGKKAGKFY